MRAGPAVSGIADILINRRRSWSKRLAVAPEAVAQAAGMDAPPDDKPIYRLLTGKDDRAFCDRVSEALDQGWRLYGSPSLAWDEEHGYMKAVQAVVWKDADVLKE